MEQVESWDGAPGSVFTPLSAAAVQEQRDHQRSGGCRIQPRGQRTRLIVWDNAGENILMETDFQ